MINEAPLVITRTNGFTSYELALPWKELAPFKPKDKTTAKFSFVVFDSDDERGFKQWIQWTPGVAGGKDPGAFKEIVFVKP
ncbi:MAG: hypothetical protein GX616_08815 [Planctomycetes bacterium]|nr:hypothetical protein [Planctomycetota bacterium]